MTSAVENSQHSAQPNPEVVIFHPSQGDAGRIVAFIDIGTNSLRLLLVRINPNQSYTILTDQKEMVRLGEGEFADQYLRNEAMERGVQVAKQFAAMARAYHAESISAVATSATREAKNKEEFIRRLEREAGLDVRTVSGREEARLIYLGVSSGVHLEDQPAMFIDIGGGSTEVIVGDQHQYAYLDSLKLGAIRLTTLYFLPSESGSVPPERYALLQQYVRNTAIRTVQNVQQHPFDLAIGSSGTIENLADIAIQLFFKRRRIRDDVLTLEQLDEVVKMLCALSLDERRRVPGINPARADIIIAGAAILHTLMQDLDVKEIQISDRGLRDGLLIDYLGHSEHADLVRGIPVRERSVLQLGRACGFDELHARRVAAMALELFDSAREAGLHHLGDRARELLEYSALLHDVGMFLAYSNHQAHTYYLIRNADLLGFDQREIAIIATVGYFHRHKYPKKKHPQYAALDRRDRKTVRALAILLRIAESLDRSHTGVVQQARFVRKNKNRVTLEIYGDENYQLELWGVLNQRRVFEKAFKCKLQVATCQGQETAVFEEVPS
jgi:exopolyphosphatase/guanosine-5'-triphosphate,3'-diphosphate pyrophosphatase